MDPKMDNNGSLALAILDRAVFHQLQFHRQLPNLAFQGGALCFAFDYGTGGGGLFLVELAVVVLVQLQLQLNEVVAEMR